MDTVSNDIETENTEIPLERKMESLEINEASCSIEPRADNLRRRSLRKRVPQVDKTEGKRRVTIKPKKRLNMNSTARTADINQIYLCKQIKRLAPNLETIFEEPKLSKSNEMVYSEARRKKRFLVFDQNNIAKIKKRHQKAKKLFGKTILKNKRGSMDLLLKKLRDVE